MGKRKMLSPQKVAQYGIMIALVATLTSFYFPIPATKGYFNLGEIAIFFAAFMFGSRTAVIAGVIGASIIDAIFAPYFIPATIVAKGIEAFLAGTIATAFLAHPRQSFIWAWAFVIGGSLMVMTYFYFEWFILPLGISETGGLAAAVTEFPFNVAQMIIGGLVAIFLANGIIRAYPNIRNLRD